MRILALIPARGGSKGIPNKNIKLLKGKPLLQYTIDAVRKVIDDSLICVSTDSLQIKNMVESIGLSVPFIRPLEISTDEATTQQVILHALDFYNRNGKSFDWVLLLQPTSPLRLAKHINEAISLLEDDIDMVISTKITKANPYALLYEYTKTGEFVKVKNGSFSRRQDLPIVYEINGAIYIYKVSSLISGKELIKKKNYVMSELNSLDIDTPLDWIIAERLIEELDETN